MTRYFTSHDERVTSTTFNFSRVVLLFVIFFVLSCTLRASSMNSESVAANKNTTMFTLYLRGLVRQMIVRQPQFLHSASHLGDVRVFSSRSPLHPVVCLKTSSVRLIPVA